MLPRRRRRCRRSAELGEDLVRQVPHVLVDGVPLGLARLVGRCDFVPEEVLRGVATGAARVDARRRPDVDRRDRDAVGVLGGGRLLRQASLRFLGDARRGTGTAGPLREVGRGETHPGPVANPYSTPR